MVAIEDVTACAGWVEGVAWARRATSGSGDVGVEVAAGLAGGMSEGAISCRR